MSTTHIYDVTERKSHHKSEHQLKMLKATWIVHRYAIIGLIAYFAGVSLYLVVKFPDTSFINNLSTSELLKSNNREVMDVVSTLTRRAGNYRQYLFLVPILSAVFVGAPLLSRTFETSTYKIMWSQGAGRFRVVRTEIAVFLAITAIGSFGVGTVFQNYWSRPIVYRATGLHDVTGFNAENWGIYGLIAQPAMSAAFAVLCFSLAIFLGAFTKRTIVAMALTLFIAGSLFAVAPRVLHIGQQIFAHQVRTDDPFGARPETTKILVDAHLMFANGRPNSEMYIVDRGWLEADGSVSPNDLGIFIKRDVHGMPVSYPSGGQTFVIVSEGPEFEAILKRINKPFVITYETPADFPKFVALEAGLLALISAILLVLTGLVIRRRN